VTQLKTPRRNDLFSKGLPRLLDAAPGPRQLSAAHVASGSAVVLPHPVVLLPQVGPGRGQDLAPLLGADDARMADIPDLRVYHDVPPRLSNAGSDESITLLTRPFPVHPILILS
jgi:hypothetical protein